MNSKSIRKHSLLSQILSALYQNHSSPCADSESFVRRCPTQQRLFFRVYFVRVFLLLLFSVLADAGREDLNTTKSVSSSARPPAKRHLIIISDSLAGDDGLTTFNDGLVHVTLYC